MGENQKQKSAGRLYFRMALIALILVVLDQWTKHLAAVTLKVNGPIELIDGVLELMYLENRGAAFSMLQNQQWFFILLTAVFLIAAIWLIRKIPKTGRFLPLLWTIDVLVAGAVGNLIDRVAHAYVIDFIYFSIINFPVFNVADIYVTISVVVLVCLMLFHYHDEDFRDIFPGKETK